ncbi:FAD-dependent oxidoreductase [Phaeobacter inhibens]
MAIDLVAAAASETLEQTLLRERRTFLDLRQSQQAHALRHVFFAERAALSQGRAFAAPKTELSRAVVVGGGNMGASIAYALASAGLEVTVVETDANAVNRAKDNIARLITQGAAFALARRLGKMPVLSGVCDGFIGNRILTRYRHAADTLLLQGATPDSIDAAMRAFGMAMGPYQAQDLSGLDIAYANRKRQAPGDRQDRGYVPIADRLVEDLKRLGRKTNAGWYDYDADGTPQPSQIVLDCIVATSAQAKIPRESIAPQVISARLLLAMIAEACAILTEGIAARPADIDLVLVHGYGFPRWRGGLMYQADRIGVPMLIDQLNALCENDPFSWSVPGLLTELAAANCTLNSLNT